MTTYDHLLVSLVLCLSQNLYAQTDTSQAIGQGATERLALTAAPKPGDKLGLLYDEAIKALDPDVRQFLDGVLRLYREPGLIGNRKVTLEALGAKVAKRNYFTSEGQPRPTFREDFAPTGIYSRKGWTGYYFYDGVKSNLPNRWTVRIEIRQNPKTSTCINSRAVEGYMNLYWEPVFHQTAHKPYVLPSEWDRHGVLGRMVASPLSPTSVWIAIEMIEGCLALVDFGKTINFMDMNNDNIYD